MNLNFDMLGSVNAVRFVYDGDGDAYGTAGPKGSDVIEDVFNDYFASQGLATEPTEFDGRSDYFGFIEAGIPAGGLFSGAEGIKSPEQAAIFGGVAGEPYDPCYHADCDTVANVDPVVLDQMADAVAHTTLVFGLTKSSVNGTGKGNGQGHEYGPRHGEGGGRRPAIHDWMPPRRPTAGRHPIVTATNRSTGSSASAAAALCDGGAPASGGCSTAASLQARRCRGDCLADVVDKWEGADAAIRPIESPVR